MTDVIFYEKPGCSNNARQKQLLEAAGHRLSVRNLLVERWTADRLRSFFGTRPVSDWFNKAAPKVKSGEVDPSTLDAAAALAAMLADPILIRRPLIEADGARSVGFDPAEIETWIGLTNGHGHASDLETCRRPPAMKSPAADDGATR